MRGGVRAFCGVALTLALLAFAGVAHAAEGEVDAEVAAEAGAQADAQLQAELQAEAEAEMMAEVQAQTNAELALEAAAQMAADAQTQAYSEAGVSALQAAQVAAGVLTQAEADAGLMVSRVVNTRITERLSADVIARLSSPDDSGYDEAFAKQASDYSAAAYYDGNPASALNYASNSNNFELGTKAQAPYWGGDVSAYTGIDKNKNLIVVGYEGTSNGGKQLVAEGLLGYGRNVPNCPGCKTTQYFGKAQEKLYPQISASVRDLEKKCPTCKVLVTGHSLGGAMAQNGAYQMMKDGTLKTAPQFYTFGQPKTGNPQYNAEFNKLIPNAYRVTHDTDLVPTVGARAKGTNVGTEISYNGDMTSYTKCDGAGCGNKLKSELVSDAKTNAKDTFGKPLPTWNDVFHNPLKSAGDVLKRPIDFAKKEYADVKKDVGHSVDQHVEYFGKNLGGEFDAKDADIKKWQAEQDAKAKADADKAAADPAATRGMPQPLMAMPPGMGDDKDKPQPQPQDGDQPKDGDKPKPAKGALPPGADGGDKPEEKLEDKQSGINDEVKSLLKDDKNKNKNKTDKKQAKDNKKLSAKAKAKAKAKDKKKQTAAKDKKKANAKKVKKQQKKQKKSPKKSPKKVKKSPKKQKKQKKSPKKAKAKSKAKGKKVKKAKAKAKPKKVKKAKAKAKKTNKKRAPKRAKRAAKRAKRAAKRAKRAKRAAKRRAPKRRAAKRRAAKRRAPKRRAPKRRAARGAR